MVKKTRFIVDTLILKYSPRRDNRSIQDPMSYHRQTGTSNVYSAVPLFISIIRTLMAVQALLRAPGMTTRLPLLHVRLRPFKLAAFHGTAAQCQVLELPHPHRYNILVPMKWRSKAGNVSSVSDSYWRILMLMMSLGSASGPALCSCSIYTRPTLHRFPGSAP